ncbi:MAG: NUDIX domain-containing protein [Thermoplasmata archaeon]
MYDLKLKMWLVRDGEFVLSDGRAHLLRRIKGTKSISKAAKEMDMSYRHAWGILQRIAENAGGEIVASSRGGKKGGETTLTPLGEEILSEYDNRASSLQSQFENHWRKPSVTCDGIVFKDGRVVLIKRRNDPFRGSYALPGGFTDYGEKLEDCVVREVLEETGLRTQVVGLVGVYSAPGRDPRGHFVTAVYELRHVGGALKAGDDASSAAWFLADDIPHMAFDHAAIIAGFLAKKNETGK